jgi:diacylglycerol kinase family enzyme
VYLRAKRVRVEAAGKSVPWEIDGEPLGRLPVEIEALPSALRIAVPG